MAVSGEAYEAAKSFAEQHKVVLGKHDTESSYEDAIDEYVKRGDALLRCVLSEDDAAELPALPSEE